MHTPQIPPPRTTGDSQSRRPDQPIELDARRVFGLARRALLRRCPHCGGTPIFANYFRLLPVCPHCGLRLDRGETDYFLGAYFLNLVVAEIIFAVALVILVIATWPTPPWDALEYICAAGVVLAPILFYPYSKTLWLAGDLAFRPPTAEDIDQYG